MTKVKKSKNVKKAVTWCSTTLLCLYLFLILFPQLLFANSFTYKNFTVYHHENKIDEEKLRNILENALTLLRKSELFETDFKQSIFLCDSYPEFTFFAPKARKAFAVNFPITQHIFIAKANIDENLVQRNFHEFNSRNMHAVIAHETVHSFLEDKMGTVSYKMLPSWKNEGYCDFIANESSYKTANEKDAVCNFANETNSPSFTYFKYRMLTQFLFENEAVKINDFLNEAYDLKVLEEKYCKTLKK